MAARQHRPPEGHVVRSDRVDDARAKNRPKHHSTGPATTPAPSSTASSSSGSIRATRRQPASAAGGRRPARRAGSRCDTAESGAESASSDAEWCTRAGTGDHAAEAATVRFGVGVGGPVAALMLSALFALTACESTPRPALTPLETPTALQAAAPRVNSALGEDRNRLPVFESRAVGKAPAVPLPIPSGAAEDGEVTPGATSNIAIGPAAVGSGAQ